jgi:hypothetical protein
VIHRVARSHGGSDAEVDRCAVSGAVETMRSIKRALDPKNIMNPGKVSLLEHGDISMTEPSCTSGERAPIRHR